MHLLLSLLHETPTSTVSALSLDGEHICYVIEDGHNAPKVAGETRIPGRTYTVVPRRVGGFYERYQKRYGHDFVPWLIDVPDFTWILIHLGNFVKDTQGCLLPNMEYLRSGDTYYGKNSKEAYMKVYALLKQAFEAGDDVYLTVDRTYPAQPEDEEPQQPTEEQEEDFTNPITWEDQPPEPTMPLGCAWLLIPMLTTALLLTLVL